MGRRPDGVQALTGAERQARYRARQQGRMAATATRHPPSRARLAPRAQRWHAAVAALVALRDEYAAWLAASPEATREGATGEALQALVDLDLDEIIAIQPPRGFGRD